MERPTGDPDRRTIGEDRILDDLLLHGWVFEVRAGQRDTARADAAAALERLVALGLPHATGPAGTRLFDPVELHHFIRWAGLHRGDRTYEARHIATARRAIWAQAGATAARHDHPPLAVAPARRCLLTLTRTFRLSGHQEAERVRLRLPRPLEGPEVSNMQLSFLGDPHTPVEPIFTPTSVDIVAPVPARREVTLGITATFDAAIIRAGYDTAPLAPADTALWLRPDEGFIRISTAIAALAARIAGPETTEIETIRRLWAWLAAEVSLGPIHYDALDPRWPLDSIVAQGRSDCRLGSALLVALCRARALPARLVHGYVLHAVAPYLHTWLEVWLDGPGWLPLDLCELSAGGRDADWRDLLFGCLDHRVAVERPPRLASGAGPLRLPARWVLLPAIAGTGVTTEIRTADGARLVYRDHLEVALGPPEQHGQVVGRHGRNGFASQP